MKKVLSLALCILIVISLVLSVSAVSQIQLKSINFDKSSLTLDVGKTYNLQITFTPANTTQKLMKFITSDKNIATVDSKGKITALKSGKAVITVVSSLNSKIMTKCNITISQSAVQPKPVTVTIGLWPAETDTASLKLFEGYKKILKEKYPYIKVNGECYPYDPKTFVPRAESGSLPNVTNVWLTEPQKIINAGYAADITDIVKKYGYDKKINPALLNIATKDGKMYGLPVSGYKLGLWCNVNLFKQAGLLDQNGVPKYPKTFDELALTAKTITEKTGKPGMLIAGKDHVGGWHFTNIAWAFGTVFEKQVNGKWTATFNSPEGVAALQYVKDLKWKYNALSDNALLGWGDFVKNFGTDQVGMAFGPGDSYNVPVTDYKMSKDNIAEVSIPAGPKQKVSLVGGNMYMFSNNSTPEQLDACLKFMQIMGYTPEVTPESLKSLDDSLKSNKDANRIVGPLPLEAWSDQSRLAAEDKIYKKYTNVNLDMFKDFLFNSTNLKAEEPINCQDLYGILDGVMQNVLTDKNADPKALMDKAAADFQSGFLNKAN